MVHLLVLSTVVLSSAVASTQPIEWQQDYGKALAATRADERPLLVVLEMPSDPKTAAEEEQLSAEGDQADLLSAYQLCRIDASTEYGQRVAEVFKAKKFPFTAVIDKTGSVVLCKKRGQLSDAEWNQVLSTYKSGDRSTPINYSTAYRGTSFSSTPMSTSVVSPSYCPSCQRNAQRSF